MHVSTDPKVPNVQLAGGRRHRAQDRWRQWHLSRPSGTNTANHFWAHPLLLDLIYHSDDRQTDAATLPWTSALHKVKKAVGGPLLILRQETNQCTTLHINICDLFGFISMETDRWRELLFSNICDITIFQPKQSTNGSSVSMLVFLLCSSQKSFNISIPGGAPEEARKRSWPERGRQKRRQRSLGHGQF